MLLDCQLCQMHEFVPRQMLLMFCKSNGHDHFNVLGEGTCYLSVLLFPIFGSEDSLM